MYRARGMGITLDDLAGAITRMEGACSAPGTCRNNNPGNLTPRSGGWPGQVGVDSRGFAIFDNYTSGYNALLTQEQANVNRGLNLSQFFAGSGTYPGFDPGNSQYGPQVAQWLGVDANTPLSSLLGPSSSPPPDVTTGADFPPVGDGSGADGPGISPAILVGAGLAGIALLYAMTS